MRMLQNIFYLFYWSVCELKKKVQLRNYFVLEKSLTGWHFHSSRIINLWHKSNRILESHAKSCNLSTAVIVCGTRLLLILHDIALLLVFYCLIGTFQNWRTFSVPPMKFQIIQTQIAKSWFCRVTYTSPDTKSKYSCSKSVSKILQKIQKSLGAPPKMAFFSCPTSLMANLHVK